MRGNSKMDPSLYGKYDVKRGLRDVNGKGVLGRSDTDFVHLFHRCGGWENSSL